METNTLERKRKALRTENGLAHEGRNHKLRMIESAQGSTLNTSIEATYQPSYLLGYGFDVMRSGIANRALEEFEVQRVTTKDSVTDVRSVTSQNEMQMELNASLKGDFTVDGVNVGIDSEYLHKLKASTSSMSIVAEYSVQDTGYSVAPLADYQLTPEAQQYFDDNGEDKFRAQYGEYYIAGYQYGSKFYGVYTCESSSVEKFDEFKVKLTASMPDLFSAAGALAFSNLVKQYDISIEVQSVMVGYDGTPPDIKLDPETILELLNWFKDNADGKPIATLMMSYSNILPGYSNTIDISPDVFTRVSMTYNNYWLIGFLYNSIPSYYQDQKRTAYQEVMLGIESHFNEFMKDPSVLDEYYFMSANFMDDLQTILDREELYHQVVNSLAAAPEPATGKEVDEDSINTRTYGISSTSATYNINIDTHSKTFREDWHVGWREGTFDWSDDNKVIIGWKVESNKTKNGHWQKTSNGQATLSSSLKLYIKSGYDRGIDYKVTVYYVNKNQFNFS